MPVKKKRNVKSKSKPGGSSLSRISSSKLEELKAITQVRAMVAEEVDAKANLIQAQVLREQAFWTKWMTVGTFLMAVATALLAVSQFIVP